MRFLRIGGPRRNDICYATQNRQDAVQLLPLECDILLAVGRETSSNSNRLREIAERLEVQAFLIDGSVAVGAGASAPEVLAREVIDRLCTLGGTLIPEYTRVAESVTFFLLAELK